MTKEYANLACYLCDSLDLNELYRHIDFGTPIYRCNDCGFLQSLPPSEAFLEQYYARHYRQKTQTKLSEELANFMAGRAQAQRRFIAEFSDPDATFNNVLDVGAGWGAISRLFVEEGAQVWAIEDNPRCREHISEIPGVTLISHSNLADDGFAGHFDLIICSHVLEHFTNPIAGLRQLRNVLNPGTGQVFIELPNEDSPLLEDYIRKLKADRGHTFFFSHQTMLQFLEKTGGFVVQKTRADGISVPDFLAGEPYDQFGNLGKNDGIYLRALIRHTGEEKDSETSDWKRVYMSDLETRDQLIYGLNEDLIKVERSLRRQTNEIQNLLKNISETSAELPKGSGDVPPDMEHTALRHLASVSSLSKAFLTLQQLEKRLEVNEKRHEVNEKLTAQIERQLRSTTATADKVDRFVSSIRNSILYKGVVLLNDGAEYLQRKVGIVTGYLSRRKLDRQLAETKPFDVLVVGGDFTSLTGIHRPITNYLNYCKEQGFSVHCIDLTNTKISRYKAKMLAKRAKTIVFNGSKSFLYKSAALLADAIQAEGKSFYCYMHETQWAFDSIQERWPVFYKRLEKYLPKGHVLCCTYVQRTLIRERFKIQASSVVYNNTQPLLDTRPETIAVAPLEAGEPLNILMVGSVQKRKGVDLFSELADEARERELPWSFTWVGPGNGEGLYQSENVDWTGPLRGEALVQNFLRADVIFIASVDDPLPLVCTEAIQIFRRLVVYRGIGTSEILNNLSGTAIYEEYTVDAAIGAIEKAVQNPIDLDGFDQLVKNYGDVPTFSERLNQVIGLKAPQANFVSHPFFAGAAQNFIDSGPFADALDRPLVVVANGPSCGGFDPRRIPENPVVFRCNLFMFEEGYPFGTHADGMFWCIHRRILQEALATTIDTKLYSVDNFFTPMSLRNTALPAFRDRAESLEERFQPHFSHLNLVRLNPRLAKYFMARNKRASTELPTQGLQMVAAGCALGFKKIYVVGLDFYEKTESRYPFEWPDYISSLVAPKHSGSFEQGAHSRDMETGFLAAVSEEFPDVEILAVSEDSYLSKLKPLAPILDQHWRPDAPNKDNGKFHEDLKRHLRDIDGVFLGAQIRGGILHGWAWKPSEPDLRLKVDIFRGNQRVTTLEANAYDDALDQNSVGDAHHAFTVPVNQLKGSGTIDIAYGRDARITVEPTNGAAATCSPRPKPSAAAAPPGSA